MNDVVVIFNSDGSVRIKHGVDKKDYKDRTDVAINPVIPRGIPPHQWKLNRKGYIEGTAPSKKKHRDFLVGLFSGIIISYVFYFIVRHV